MEMVPQFILGVLAAWLGPHDHEEIANRAEVPLAASRGLSLRARPRGNVTRIIKCKRGPIDRTHKINGELKQCPSAPSFFMTKLHAT